MQLVTSRVDEIRIKMMITAACKPLTSGKRDGVTRAEMVNLFPGVGYAPSLVAVVSTILGSYSMEEIWCREDRLGDRVSLGRYPSYFPQCLALSRCFVHAVDEKGET